MTIHFPSKTDTAARLDAGRPRLVRRVRGRQRATRAAVIGGVLIVASSATAATAVVAQAGHTAVATGVTCFVHDDLNSYSTRAAVSQQQGGSVQTADVATKRDMCALVWKGGLKQAASDGGNRPNIDPNTSTLPVPRLAMCTLTDGTTGGFPVETPATSPAQVCDRLGLPLLG